MEIQAISGLSSMSSSAPAQAVSQKVSSGGKSGGGGGGAAKTQSSSSSSTDSTTYDKMDLNKDGTVSASEKALYLMMNPQEAENENSITNYTSHGTQDEYAGGFSGFLNLFA